MGQVRISIYLHESTPKLPTVVDKQTIRDHTLSVWECKLGWLLFFPPQISTISKFGDDTVDGSELRRSPVEVGRLSYDFMDVFWGIFSHQAWIHAEPDWIGPVVG